MAREPNPDDLCIWCRNPRSAHSSTPADPSQLACSKSPRGSVGPLDFVDFVTAEPLRVPSAPASRKDHPLFSGCLAYFPDALLAVARLSKLGNDKHNPGQPLHWSKGKSNDHADCIARHLLQHGEIDPETGLSHTVAVAWRALALLQTEIEAAREKASNTGDAVITSPLNDPRRA